MNSLWKDLLILHGHLVQKEELNWNSDASTRSDRDEGGAPKPRSNVKPGSNAVKCCMALAWPRLSAPR